MAKTAKVRHFREARARTARAGRKRRAVASPAGDVERLRGWLEERQVRKAKIGAFDVDGVWRGKYVSLEKLLSAAKSGLGFCDVVFGWDLADELYDNARVTG
jgi:glutamine synthetase